MAVLWIPGEFLNGTLTEIRKRILKFQGYSFHECQKNSVLELYQKFVKRNPLECLKNLWKTFDDKNFKANYLRNYRSQGDLGNNFISSFLFDFKIPEIFVLWILKEFRNGTLSEIRKRKSMGIPEESEKNFRR